MQAWDESCTRLNLRLRAAYGRGAGYACAASGPPCLDGKLSGLINFMALHETYHVGQAAYVRSWLGHPGVMG